MSTLCYRPLKLVDLGSSISSTESDVNMYVDYY